MICEHCVYAEKSEMEEPCASCETHGDIPTNYISVEEVEQLGKEDDVTNPPHYKHGDMETIDEMIMLFGVDAVVHFCICNAWKYRARALYKNGEEDMKKSNWYLNKVKDLTRYKE